jgi:hypothetical protein
MCGFLFDSATSGVSNSILLSSQTSVYAKLSTSMTTQRHRVTHVLELIPLAFACPCPTDSALSAFSMTPNGYLTAPTPVYYQQFQGVSLTACTALCARDPTCLSFVAGISGREGDCFLSNATQSSSKVTLVTA